jgi:hypothetical protein
MEPIKIVVRYTDGRTLKGYTHNFLPNKPSFHVRPFDAANINESAEIQINDLKAVFFVRDFSGNPDYKENKQLPEGKKPPGRMVEVTFKDGEIMIGSTMGYDSQRPGFFIFPIDPLGNNLRAYIVAQAVNNVRYV